MDEDSQDGKATAFSRHRSPTFSVEEVKTLVKLVEKYKNIIFNKSTNSAANHAKEKVWSRIGKIFNNEGFTHFRTPETLRTKLENLKREARKVSKNLMDIRVSEFDDVTNQIVAMMCAAESNTSILEEPLELKDDDFGAEEQTGATNNSLKCNDNEDKVSEDSEGESEIGRKKIVNRSVNFTPEECTLLLQCVRYEKGIIFSKATNTKAMKLKHRAWSRVTQRYNKQSPHKRSCDVLRKKFINMKRLTKDINIKDYINSNVKQQHEKIVKDYNKIKTEPLYECKGDSEVNCGDNFNDDYSYSMPNSNNNHIDIAADPLTTVLNAQSRIGPINNSENKEIVKLKLELLNYEMETAKLQRKRIEEAIQAEAAERESRALESALRVRAARLETAAAAARLPAHHPALAFPPDEARAQQYLHVYHHT